jgi:hypothetical protein
MLRVDVVLGNLLRGLFETAKTRHWGGSNPKKI